MSSLKYGAREFIDKTHFSSLKDTVIGVLGLSWFKEDKIEFFVKLIVDLYWATTNFAVFNISLLSI